MNRDIPVSYDDPSHKYYIGDRLYRSSSQIVGVMARPFDTKERSEYMSDRYGQDPVYWLNKWLGINKASLTRGTRIHDKQEAFLYNQGFDYINGRKLPVHRLTEIRSTLPGLPPFYTLGGGSRYPGYRALPDGVYPELKLWHHGWGIAGRSDKVILDTVEDIRYAHVEDYKTNRVVARRSSWMEQLLPPLDHLEACEFNEYALQLSLYMFMLEYQGFTPGRLRLIHFPHAVPELPGEPLPIPMEVPYLRIEVQTLLPYLTDTGWLRPATA